MSRILFYMKQSRHWMDSLSFMRKLEAQGFSCRMCGESGEDDQSGEFFSADFEDRESLPADFEDGESLPAGSDGGMSSSAASDEEKSLDKKERPSLDPAGDERALVITDDIMMAGICELRKIACIGYCPSESEETGQDESVLSEHAEKGSAAEAKKGSAAEESRESDYFPHVRMVWESFDDREPEELEQFRCRFYGEPVVIARTERLLIRESIPEDFEAVYRMESDVTSGQEYRESREKICFCGMAGDDRKEKKEDCAAEETFCFHEKKGEFCSYNEEKEKFCSYIENVYPFYGYGYWTVELTEPGREGTVIGRCGLKDYEPGEDDGYVVMKKEAGDELSQVFPPELFCLELGYVVAESYRRQGYAYEMCQSVLDYAFAVLCADAVVVRIHPQNRASLMLARKLGFLKPIL